MRIGFIGLGNMGAPMARNLAQAGHEVMGFDVADVTVEDVTIAPDFKTVALGQDVVITMLPNGAILKDVAAQILPHMAKGALLLDCSTVDVESAAAVAADAEALGVMAVDAPVSGGIGGADQGTLTFMAGGSDAGFARAQPFLKLWGKRLHRQKRAGRRKSAQHDPWYHHDWHL